MRLKLGIALGVVLVITYALTHVARVPDSDMAPSLLPGDIVVLGGGVARPGDVVAIVDPLDPDRWTLRRVEAVSGSIRYDEVGFARNDDTEKVSEMGRDTDVVVLQEGNHLVRRRGRSVLWEMEEQEVAAGTLFLGADNRDEALDSRWWGAVPSEAIAGVVQFRFGRPTHLWRGWLAFRG